MRFSKSSHCPRCFSKNFNRQGHYYLKNQKKYRQRYRCLDCNKSFSNQTFDITYRQKRSDLNSSIERLLLKGVSQRGAAQLLNVDKNTIDSRVQWFGKHFQFFQKPNRTIINELYIDEMESIEHTKLKPITIPLAVSDQHQLLGVAVGKIPAKGRLADLSRKKYGFRENSRGKALLNLFNQLKDLGIQPKTIKTDESPYYVKLVKKYFPNSIHQTFNSRSLIQKKREMVFLNQNKKIFDPLFPINHMCARLRDDIKRLTRRSWCTTKKPENLEILLNLYRVQSVQS